MQRPLILISNDDGYHAKGINSLINMLRGMGDILVCAPESARSGFSRAFSTTPLSLKHRRHEQTENGCIDVWSCSGTPVDCVKMAYAKLCPRKADIILSGINHGDNASTNGHYSGTVGVAIEGAMKGIPSIAFSLCDYDDDADFSHMTALVQQLVRKVLQEGLPHYTCLNVNVPEGGAEEVRFCRMAHGHWRNEVETQHHPGNGKPFYWMCGYYQNDEPEAEDTDAWALAHGMTAITPLTVEMSVPLPEELQQRLLSKD